MTHARDLSCEAFRERFEPGRAGTAAEEAFEAHRATCPACRRYAEALRLAASAGLDRPLPPALEGRLRAIAQPRADQPRAEHRRAEHRPAEAAPAPLAAAPPAAGQDLTAAPPAPPAPRLPMPRGLEDRLRAIARQPGAAATTPAATTPAATKTPAASSVPPGPTPRRRRNAWWLESAAASVAASLLLVVLAGALWGNPVTALRPRAERLALRVSAAIEGSRADGRDMARQVIVPARQRVERRLVGARRSLERISVEIGPGPAGEVEAP